MATYTTFLAAQTGLLENLDFEETGSIAKAKAVVSAANAWIVLVPDSASDQGSSLTISPDKVAAILERARRYVSNVASQTSANSRVRFLSVDRFRE